MVKVFTYFSFKCCSIRNGSTGMVHSEWTIPKTKNYLIRVDLDKCGTTVAVQGDDLIFTNTLYNDHSLAANEEITGHIFIEPLVTVRFSCVYRSVLEVDGTQQVQEKA